MKFMVTSHRGHHEATVEDAVVSEALFNKLAGIRTEPLPEEYKVRIPDTFQELAGLWKDEKMGYTPIGFGPNEEMMQVKEYSPDIEKVIFLAPITGG